MTTARDGPGCFRRPCRRPSCTLQQQARPRRHHGLPGRSAPGGAAQAAAGGGGVCALRAGV